MKKIDRKVPAIQKNKRHVQLKLRKLEKAAEATAQELVIGGFRGNAIGNVAYGPFNGVGA